MKKISESVWGDVLDRGTGETIRKEDDINLLDVDGLYDYIKSKYEKRIFYLDKYTGNFNLWEICVDIIGNISLKAIYNEDGEIDHIVLSWSGVGVKIRHSFLWDLSEKFNMKNVGTCRRVIKEKDDTCTNKTYIDIIEFFLNNKDNMLVNESTWGGILDRGAGETVRKEDDLTPDDMKYSFIGFAERIVYYEQYENTFDDFEKFMKERWNIFTDDGKKYVQKQVDYTRRNWEKGKVFKKTVDEDINRIEENIKKLGFEKEPGKTIDATLDDWWDSLESYEKQDVLIARGAEDNYVHPDEMWRDLDWTEKMTEYVECHSTNESVWKDMLDKGTGEKIKKEDDMNSDDFLMLRETAKMFKNVLNRSANEPWSGTCDDFIKYINLRKKEHFWNDIPDEVYDKVIKFVKDNWGDCTGIQEFIDKHLSNINECEGVPGGATPANVGGMGAAYFPGPDGTPGSGDLPSPTGIVYHQVAPYTMFLKQIKKKKKKSKKFRKEDEPCVHSPNAKVYDYVDDFREYVDRTYNQMDRR